MRFRTDAAKWKVMRMHCLGVVTAAGATEPFASCDNVAHEVLVNIQ